MIITLNIKKRQKIPQSLFKWHIDFVISLCLYTDINIFQS